MGIKIGNNNKIKNSVITEGGCSKIRNLLKTKLNLNLY